jgi:hypothetical protein
MSDNWIILIPEDPRYLPSVASQERARQRFLEIAPDADEIEIQATENVVFFDCGGNLERILCPSCRAEIPIPWWTATMDSDYDGGFRLEKYAVPCCGELFTLHELHYEWPEGFGRFGLDAMNPNLGLLDETYKREFEEILGTPLRVIYQHI